MPKNMQKKKKYRMSLCNLYIDVQPQKNASCYPNFLYVKKDFNTK